MSETLKFTFVIGFITFLGAISAGIYIPALPELSKIFQTHTLHMKASITLYFIGTLLGVMFAGPLSDKYGRQKVLSLFICVFCVASLLCGMATSIFTFLAGRFFQGVGIIGAPVIAIATTTDQYRGFLYKNILSLILAILTAGTEISHLLGTILFECFGWESIFYFLFVMGGIAIFLFQNIEIRPHPSPLQKKDLVSSSLLLTRRMSFRYYQAIIGALEASFYAFTVLSPYIFRLQYGWDMFKFSLFGLVISLGLGASSALHAKLTSLMGERGIIIIGLALLMFVFVVLFVANTSLSDLEFSGTMALFIIGSDVISKAIVPKILREQPGLSGTSSSFLMLSKSIACVLGLGLILLFPENIRVISYVILITFSICSIGYIKVRKDLSGR